MTIRRASSAVLILAAVMVPARPTRALPVSAAPATLHAPPSMSRVAREVTRVRSTGRGALFGGLIGSGAAATLMFMGCSISWEPGRGSDHACNSSRRYLGVAAIGAGIGTTLGAIAGAAILRRKPASYQASWWERADGEIGAAFIQLGGNRTLDQEGASLMQAIRAGLMVQLGPFFAFGPEVAGYLQRVPESALLVGPSGKREPAPNRTTLDLGIAARAVLPLGRLSPYLVGGYGRLALFGQGFNGGSVGAGAEWRVLRRLGVGLESRLHLLAARTPSKFVDATVGSTLHW